MLKYTETAVVMAEVPDEITLAINISGCPIKCPDCHSKYLWRSLGNYLDESVLMHHVNANKGITCVAFMGGDNDYRYLLKLAESLRTTGLKLAWYSGRDDIPEDAGWYFDYIKIGHFDKLLGPLDKPTTNQRMYKIDRISTPGDEQLFYTDITSKFWK